MIRGMPTEEEKKEYLEYTCPEKVYTNYINGLEQLEKTRIPKAKKRVLIAGGMVGFDKGLSHFLNEWYKCGGELFLLSEVTAEYRRYTEERIMMPHICTPHLLAKEIIVLGMDINVSKEIESFCESRKYIREAIDNIEERYRGRLGKGYAQVWAYYANCYIELLLQKTEPKVVVLWNQFYAFHMIFAAICERKRIPVVYMEFGSLPGTIALDYKGQMGESEIANNYRKYRTKKIDSKTEKHIVNIIHYLKNSGMNRNVQPKCCIKDINLIRYDCRKKTILYMGQNDYESGIYPRNKKSKKFHSPIFDSTVQAFEYLNLLAIKNNWNLIYKPHPIMIELKKEIRTNVDNADIVGEVNVNSVIDFADVIVTILSQSAYIALIREKPVVMLGFTQLKRKKCTYEAFKKYKIEYQIKSALRNGYTNTMKDNFYKHVMQLLEYNLYDDGTDREERYGQSVDKLFEEIV